MPYTGRSHILTSALAILKQALWLFPTFASSQSYIFISAQIIFQHSAKSFSHFDFGASHSRLLLQANPTFSFRCKPFSNILPSRSCILSLTLVISDVCFEPILHFCFGTSHSSLSPQVIPRFLPKSFLSFTPSHSSISPQVIPRFLPKSFLDFAPSHSSL